MTRSHRKPFWYRCCNGADMPGWGKKFTSRSLRRRARQLLSLGDTDAFINGCLDDPLEPARGRAGTRDRDYGSAYFGDGRVGVRSLWWRRYDGILYSDDWLARVSRK